MGPPLQKRVLERVCGSKCHAVRSGDVVDVWGGYASGNPPACEGTLLVAETRRKSLLDYLDCVVRNFSGLTCVAFIARIVARWAVRTIDNATVLF